MSLVRAQTYVFLQGCFSNFHSVSWELWSNWFTNNYGHWNIGNFYVYVYPLHITPLNILFSLNKIMWGRRIGVSKNVIFSLFLNQDFSFLCCPIMCLYILSSVLWYPLRFPHASDVICVCSVRRCLPLLVGGLMSYVICACFPIVVLNIFCVVFFVVLCILCCQFLWIVHFLIAPSVFSNVYLSICVYFNNSYSVVLQRLYTRISLDIITWLYL
jgi:hypothetical protein